MKSDAIQDALRTLDAWLTFEALNPQPLPSEVELRSRGRDVVRIETGVSVPWRNERYSKSGRENGVYWIVYLAPINLRAAFDSIVKLFPDECSDELSQRQGEAAAAAIILDEQGRPLPDSVFLASFGWSYGKLRSDGLAALPYFLEQEQPFLRELSEKITRYDKEHNLVPLDHTHIHDITKWVVTELNLPANEVDLNPLCVRSPTYGSDQGGGEDRSPEPELLNSFLLTDLLAVKEQLSSGSITAALSRYLAVSEPEEKVDLVTNKDHVSTILTSSQLPSARWPLSGRHPLFLMQQAAVNHVTAELHSSGLVAVNGPPGTGKTTLLRDIVAQVYLTRAAALARFDDPSDAFIAGPEIKTQRGYSKVHRLDPSLIGHEVVVASSNNKAVENITREIPALGAISNHFNPPLRYFPSISDAVERRSVDGSKRKTWGLFAAVLGNAANRHAFFETFWWDEDCGIATYLRAITGRAKQFRDPATGKLRTPTVVSEENPPRGSVEAGARWRAAREQFHHAYERVALLQRQGTQLEEALTRRTVLEMLESDRQHDLVRKFESAQQCSLQVATFEERAALAEYSYEKAAESMRAFHSLRPRFFSRLLRREPYRTWKKQAAVHSRTFTEAKSHFTVTRRELKKAQEEAGRAKSAAAVAAKRHTDSQVKLQEALHLIAHSCSGIGANLPDESFWNQPEKQLQLCSPGIWPELQSARDELFAASVRLHRAFIDGAAESFLANLRLAVDLLKGKPLTSEEEPYRSSILATFFIVVPVVSTTFASVARLFNGAKQESIGWMLIDEAGQATPQAAAGALWRARRAVIIGDPLQIEPVVALPSRLVSAVCKTFSITSHHWAAPAASAQSLADRASRVGAVVHSSDGYRRIGIPLRVHRRCDEPMFSIANSIAYDGLMVQGGGGGASPIGAVIGESGWFHVRGESVGKWSEHEGEVVVSILRAIINAGVKEPDLFIITPFRLVAHKMRELLLHDPISHILPGNVRRWIADRVGTIHTFQGREAEAVVLLLGAAGVPSAGARRWATCSPNLLNVAVTRAKRRIYVVGNRSSWQNEGCCTVLAQSLPVTDRTWLERGFDVAV